MSAYLEQQIIRNKTSSPEDFKSTTFDSMYRNPFKPSVLLWDIEKQWRPRPEAAERGV